MLKKCIFSGLLLLGLAGNAVAQQSKEALYDKVESSYAWLSAALLERSTTLNLSEAQWDYLQQHENVGISILSNLGNNLATYLEKTADPRLVDDCRYGKDKSACAEKVAALAPRIKIVANMGAMGTAPDKVKLGMYALNSIGNFLGSNNIYGGNAGWKPKAAALTIVLNLDGGTGQPVVSWSKDYTTATVKMYVASEPGDWVANMMKGLEKGRSK